jgi:uncharacterized protein YkwD/chitodextrinase
MKFGTRHSPIFYTSASLVFLSALPLLHGQTGIVHQVSLPAGMSWCSDTMINGLFSQVNTFRSQNGVAPLSLSTLGMKDAELRAMQFATYMSTANPSLPGFNPHQGFDTTAASLGYNLVGENLAYISTDPAYIVGAIWQDPLHLAALLNSSANVTGVSCVYYNSTAYWTYEPGTCSGTGCTTTAPPPSGGTPALDSEEWTFLTLINNYRVQNGLGTLQVSVALENSSRWMSNDMAANNYFSHTDSLGRSPGARLAAFGYTYSPWGENLAAGYSSAQDAFNGWLNACDADASGNCTYAHRQNMSGAGFKAIGIARSYGSSSSYGWYWTTDFGGVVEAAIAPPGSNPPPPPAPTVTSFAATPSSIVAGQSASISWSVTGATAVTITGGIGAVSNSGSQTVTPAQTTTYTLTATNSAGTATATVTVSVIAPSAKDTTPPSAPTLTSAVARSASEIDVVWTASTDDVGVAGYQVLRNGSVVGSIGAGVLSFADTGVAPATTYTYATRAFDAAGNFSVASNNMQATTPAAPVSGQACPAPASGAFTGCYYSNTSLSGNPVLARTDPQINFDWGFLLPAPAVPAGPYSVRWQGDFSFTAGTYTFTAMTSDGMRVYVDGSLVLNRWYDQPAYIYKIQQPMSAGTHRITVEYYDNTGYATAHLSWQNSTPATQPPAILSFTASPSALTAGQTATLSWSVNGATSITIDNGIGDVTGSTSKPVQPGQSTTYTLTASNSAGTVKSVANVTVTAMSDTQAPSTPVLTSATAKSSTEVDLAWSASVDNVGVAGYQILRNGAPLASVNGTTLAYADKSAAQNTAYTYSVKAFDAAGNNSATSNGIPVTTPVAPVSSGACPVPATGAFTSCYYNGITLSGNPVLTGTDGQINFDWGTGSPGASVTPANFSARWQGYFDFTDGVYGFSVQASDGIRVYIDGRLIVDRWQDEPVSMYQARPTLTAGSHLITVEYYAKTGWASCHLNWQHY